MSFATLDQMRMLSDIGTLLTRNPKYKREIHQFAFRISRDFACPDASCAFCVAKTDTEFADMMDIIDRTNTNKNQG